MFIEVNNIDFNYDSKEVLKNFSFFANRGESVSIMGSNGSGKSTLLKILSGQLLQNCGTVTVGKMEPYLYRKAVMLPQNYRLASHKTLTENLKLPLKLRGFSPADSELIANEQLKAFGLSRFANYYPSQLSEGVLRRAAIAEIGLFDADLLLLDEPFCGIDRDSIDFVQNYITSRRLDGTTIILVTHSVNEAEALTDRTYFMQTEPIMLR